MITQAIISAGGLGTRLRPMTDTMPKPMVSVLGKPILEWHIEQFKKYGVTEFFFTLYYLPQVVTDYFGDGSRFGVKIHYFIEDVPLGSAGAIKKFETELGQSFYYIYGDIFSLMDYGKMEDAWREKMAIAKADDKQPIGMQRVKRTDDYAGADVAELGEDGQFKIIHSKPHVAGEKYPNAYRLRGAHILDKKILSYIPDAGASDLGNQILPAVVGAGEKFYGYECDDYSNGIDTIEKLQAVEQYLKENNIGFQTV